MGEFSNPYAQSLSDHASVTAIVFDTTGEHTVIGGGNSFTDASVAPGGRARFDVPINGIDTSRIASARVSVAPRFLHTSRNQPESGR